MLPRLSARWRAPVWRFPDAPCVFGYPLTLAQEKAAKAANAARNRKRALAEAGGAPPPPAQSMKVVFKDGKLVVNDADLVGVFSTWCIVTNTS